MTAIPGALLVGNELISLRTWKMILDIKFTVCLSALFSEAVSITESEPLDLIIICGDPRNWKQIADRAALKSPLVKIIAVTVAENEQPAWVDAVICSAVGLTPCSSYPPDYSVQHRR